MKNNTIKKDDIYDRKKITNGVNLRNGNKFNAIWWERYILITELEKFIIVEMPIFSNKLNPQCNYYRKFRNGSGTLPATFAPTIEMSMCFCPLSYYDDKELYRKVNY